MAKVDGPQPVKFPGEDAAVAEVVRLGSIYGYGNLIHHLRLAWRDMLITRHGFDEFDAEQAVGLRPIDEPKR